MGIGAFAVPLAVSLMAMANAGVVEYQWDVTWVWAAPDGYGRPVIGINGKWPCPDIFATKNDEVVVHLTNRLGNQTTGLHWHGINQISTNYMDGPTMTTQCPLPPNMTMTYAFRADEAGTYWWHSHDLGQYPDGLRGALIVYDPDDPLEAEYDEEYILTISDWYHTNAVTLGQQMLQPSNRNFQPPLPDSMLLNDGQGQDYAFDKTKTYRFRIINFAALTAFMINFQAHNMTVVMNDASYINSAVASELRISPAQRYDVLITGLKSDDGNYPFLIGMDANTDFTDPNTTPVWIKNETGYLVMDPNGARGVDVVDAWLPADDSQWEPLKDVSALPQADKVFQLDFSFCFDQNNVPRACFNDNMGDPGPYVYSKVPTLYTAATTGNANNQSVVYGHIHPLIISYGDIVDIVVNNHDIAIHPFHLHGHQFEVLKRPGTGAGTWPGVNATQVNPHPPSRDTVDVYGNSYVVIRFQGNNPGVYLFHCHIEWHVPMGLTATVIEAPEKLRDYDIPADHIAACKALGIPHAGNAGGDVANIFNTSNYNNVNQYPYEGATYPYHAYAEHVART